jgi:hypothetical protein
METGSMLQIPVNFVTSETPARGVSARDTEPAANRVTTLKVQAVSCWLESPGTRLVLAVAGNTIGGTLLLAGLLYLPNLFQGLLQLIIN